MRPITSSATASPSGWQKLCHRADLVAFSGVAARLDTAAGPCQVALFYLPGHSREVYAVDHQDPFSKVNIIARGIIGDIEGAPVVASPLYKQHFRLADGQCLEAPEVKLRSWRAALHDDEVWIES